MPASLILPFKNTLTSTLPFLFQDVNCTAFSDNYLVAYSKNAAQLLSLPSNINEHDDFVKIFSGEILPTHGRYTAQVYAGHQFGHFVSQLGDGRSISMGEIANKQQQLFDIQLKGSGRTPFSRMGDGRAVLRSCIREFLASEAMAALNIPTTRALCITATSDKVYREQAEQGAIMTRITESNIRFGHFEYFFHHNKLTQLDQLADYCLTNLFPECQQAENPHLAMLTEITHRTATLIAQWQTVGFAHGVMNTDNMSILGLTLDYGPFGFLDSYQPEFICNHSDHQGRYAFDQQPSIGLWNLNALAYTFSRWLTAEQIKPVLQNYEAILVSCYNELMKNKLGLITWQNDDKYLLGQLLLIMSQTKADYTLSFRLLNRILQNDDDNTHSQEFLTLFANNPNNGNKEDILVWLTSYRARLQQQNVADDIRHQQQNSANPKYILRNYLAETAIRSANAGDFSEITKLLQLLEHPFDEQASMNAYSFQPPAWGTALEISCSS